jgi:hypothetical protein
MPKARARAPRDPSPAAQLTELGARLGKLEAVLNQIELRLDPLLELPDELARVRDLALEAVAQAQDALETHAVARAHEERLNMLTLAVAEGIAHVDRAEARIRATVGRARRQLRDAGLEDPGVEAEAGQLFGVDEETGRAQRLPAVPADVAPGGGMDPLEAQLRALKLWHGA